MREFVWFLVVLAAVAVLVLELQSWVWPSSADAQVTHRWQRFTWSNPDSGGQGVGFRLESYDDLGVPWEPKLYLDSTTASPPPSWAGLGQHQEAWVRVPVSQGRQCYYQLISLGVRDTLFSPPSNGVVLAPARPDTGYLDQSTMRWARSTLDGWVHWQRAPGDSVWAQRRINRPPWVFCPLVTSQEALQQADKAELCKQFGVWMLRGGPQPCP